MLHCLKITACSSFTMKCFSRFLYCLLLTSLFMRITRSFILHDSGTEQYDGTLNIDSKHSRPDVDARSKYESPPAFFRDLYNFLQSEKSVGENGVDFVAEPSQNISYVENSAYLSFLVYDENFTSREQFHLVVSYKQPVGTDPHSHGINHNEAGARSAELVMEIADGNSTNDFGLRSKCVLQSGFSIGEYQVFNVTELMSNAKVNNGSELIIRASLNLGDQTVDIKNFIETTPGNAESPVLVAFNDYHLRCFLSFFNRNREHSIENYEHPPNSLDDALIITYDDGVTTLNKRSIRETNNDCRVRDWYVTFKDIHWRELVYAPSGYHANFCHGSCHFGSPLRMLQATSPVSNHALVRSLFHHQMRRSKVNGSLDLPPHSCCVPVLYEPLTMLYRENSDSASYYVLKSFSDMVVTKCGCA